MPITLFVQLTTSAAPPSPPLPDETKAVITAALAGQAKWVAEHVSTASPKSQDERGAALFQQLEDPHVCLETSQWDNAAQHGQWLASEQYAAGSKTLGGHFDFGKLEYFYLDKPVLAPSELAGEADGTIGLMQSPIISVGRVTIAADKKGDFVKAWADSRVVLEEFAKPYAASGGWRTETPDQDSEEFVFFVGWPSVEKHNEFAKTEDFEKYAAPLSEYAKTRDLKHYKKVLQ
ncbi:hypothetical protein F5Y15DRAFT_88503 [Xylariaceae sp. FL0016]|nr:hypothetical protein F5Y15DRAFT_88503 [Xylariaceae sp. FL0016]